MTDERGVVRWVSWHDLFPWLIILRTFRIAIHPALLAVATAATLITPVGWWAGGWVFLEKEADANGNWRVKPLPTAGASLLTDLPPAAREYFSPTMLAVFEPYYQVADPLRRLFSLATTVREAAYFVFGSLWSLAVWALAGGLITRYAVVRLASEAEPRWQATAQFALGRYWWYFLTPLYPLVGVVLIAAPIALLGLPIYLSPGAGSILAGMLWIFVVIASLAAAWLLAGLAFGWPLMWPTISAERDGDPFEAFSRSFAYVYGKPLNYFGYVVVAALFGALCLAVVHGVALLVTEFGFWALSWGAGGDQVVQIRLLVEAQLAGIDLPDHQNPTLVFGSSIFALAVGLIRLVESAFSHSFFWCAASAIYLLLRMDVDEKEMDEVYDDERPKGTPRPPVATAPPVEPPQPPAAASEADQAPTNS